MLGALLLAAVGAGIYRWREQGFAWSEFADSLKGADVGWLAASATAILLTYLGRALRWNIMLKPLAPEASLWRVLSATCIGFTASVFFGRAGEPVRPFLIARQEKVPFASQVAAWVVERILDLLMVLLLFSVALSQVTRSGLHPGNGLRMTMQIGGYVAGGAGFGCVLLLFGIRKFRGNLANRFLEAATVLPTKVADGIARVLASFDEGMSAVGTNRSIVMLLLYSLLEWLIILLGFFCSFQAFAATHSLSPLDVIISAGFICLASAVQIPGIGGGMQVSTVVVLTELFGIKLEVATSIALILWVISFASIVPIGVGLAITSGFKWSSINEIRAESEKVVS